MTPSRKLLAQGAEVLGLSLSDAVLQQLARYEAELRHWNRRINLVARNTTMEQAVELHFLDSLTLLPLLPDTGGRLLDIGTGAGFPGLVLACARPELACILVEPRQKRVSFLKYLIRTLGLTNVELVADRIEEHRADLQGRFTHVVSRALAEPERFLELIRPLMTPAVRAVLMLAREEALAGFPWNTGPWEVELTTRLRLPFSGAPRLLAVVRLP
ncbi:MAG: 16S rRNA (guanine(527)-N(7))-methyltransferase RsmG [Desulfobulbus sp.]|jgi:16S rRNA (guanine527-N7)-methyltransferase